MLEVGLQSNAVRELDEVSRVLELTGRDLYSAARETLRRQASDGAAPSAVLPASGARTGERFELLGPAGEELVYYRPVGSSVHVHRMRLSSVGMHRIRTRYASARSAVDEAGSRDLRRGVRTAFVVLAAGIWAGALALLLWMTNQFARPLHGLTQGLRRVAEGETGVRLPAAGVKEVARAAESFNRMAEQLEAGRERALYLARLEAWRSLARKTAHEVKNSLTPIRLTVGEMVARQQGPGQEFMAQAAQIVVDEINSLERRVRAFSDYSAEPAVEMAPCSLNQLAEERVSLLRAAHPTVLFTRRLTEGLPAVAADPDLVRGMMTNLLSNAAEAAGAGGVVLVRTERGAAGAVFEVHDSGPGVGAAARATLFAPAISFKKNGMGLGLSIVKRSALACGGDVSLVKGELGGAAFRVMLPWAQPRDGCQERLLPSMTNPTSGAHSS